MNANSLFAYSYCCLAGYQLDSCSCGRVQPPLINAPSPVIHKPTGRFDLRRHIRQFVRNRLIVTDASVSDETCLSKVLGSIKSSAGHTDSVSSDSDAVLTKRLQYYRIGTLATAD